MIKILDGTFREGIQSVSPADNRKGIVFSKAQSIKLIKKLINFRVDYIEIGSPIASVWTNDLILQANSLAMGSHTKIAVHCRCNRNDVKLALEAGATVIHLYMNMLSTYRFDPTKQTASVIHYLNEYQQKTKQNIEIRYSFEDAFRTPYKDIYQTTKKIHKHITRVGLPDTTGHATPLEVKKLLFRLGRDFPQVETEFHFHNDLGLAPANALSAIENNADVIDASVLGVGERNGIISLSNLVALLLSNPSTSKSVEKKYRLHLLPEIDKLVANYLNILVPLNSTLSSPGYFTNVAGVHVDGHAKRNSQYENISPEKIGCEHSVCWASSVVGGSNILFRAKQLNVTIEKKDAKKIAASLREIAKEKGGISPKFVDNFLLNYASS